MLFDPVIFLVARSRAKKANLGNSEALKASLLGSAIGGGNIAAGVMLADHSIKSKAAQRTPAVTTPADPVNCLDKLVTDLQSFLLCADAAKLTDKDIDEIGKAYVGMAGRLGLGKKELEPIKSRIEQLCSVAK